MDRRRFVKLAGTASVATAAGLAGCSDDGGTSENNSDDDTEGTPTPDGTPEGTPDDGQDEQDGQNSQGGDPTPGERARYDSWILQDAYGSGPIDFAVSLDIAALSAVGEAEEDTDPPDDALAVTPLSFFGLGSNLATGVLGIPRSGSDQDTDQPTEYLHVASNSVIMEGNYDADATATAIEDQGATESEQYGDFTFYTIDGQNGTSVIGITSDTVIVAGASGESSPTEQARLLADANNAEATTYSAGVGEFDELMTALPDRTIMGVSYDPEGNVLEGTGGGQSELEFIEETELGPNVLGYATSATLESSGIATSSVALRYESADDVDDRSTIESALGAEADVQTIAIDGPLVVVEGEFATPASN